MLAGKELLAQNGVEMFMEATGKYSSRKEPVTLE
jgi:hypothetical protein